MAVFLARQVRKIMEILVYSLFSCHDNQGSFTGRKPLPVRPGMFLETVTKVSFTYTISHQGCELWLSFTYLMAIAFYCMPINSSDHLFATCNINTNGSFFFLAFIGLGWYIQRKCLWHNSTTSRMGKLSFALPSW